VKKIFSTLGLSLLLVFPTFGESESESSQILSNTVSGANIDIDGNEQFDALTDGLLILRSMFGLTGNSLVSGAVASDAIYSSAEDIESRIGGLGNRLDIDDNGNVDALTDGLIILRYLFGLTGDTLVKGVVATDANRVSAADIELYIATLTSLDIEPPVFTSSASFTAAENQTAIGTVTATDVDTDNSAITFTVSGSELSITSAGVLTFASAPDYETKTSYTATVTATDGTNSSTQSITVTVTDVDDVAPVFTSSASFSAAENQTAIGSVTATDVDTDNSAITFTLSGSELSITSAGVLTFASAPDYETKTSYTATVTATDGTNSATQSITVTVTNLNDNSPVFTSSASFSAAENQIVIGTVTATDVDTDNSLITFKVSGSELSITPQGLLSFSYEPDFEVKSFFSAIITATDGSNSSTQNIIVTLSDVLEVASDLTCAKTIEALLPPQAVCDNLFITQDTYIRNRTAGIADFAFGDATGHKFGPGQFMELGDNDCLPQSKGDTDSSFSFWFKDAIDITNNPTLSPQIIGTRSQYDPDSAGFIVTAQYQPQNGMIWIVVHFDGGDSIISKPVKPKQWTHIVVNYDADDPLIRFTIYTNTIPAINDNGLPTKRFKDGARLTIGYDDLRDEMPSFDLADFRSFKRQLTKNEIRQLYLQGAPAAGNTKSQLNGILDKLYSHIGNQSPMSLADLASYNAELEKLLPLFSSDVPIIKKSLELVTYYDAQKGPLFINDTSRGGFKREGEADIEVELARIIFKIQQAMIDHQYTRYVLPMCSHIFTDQVFESSANFPGTSVKSADTANFHAVTINAYNPDEWGLRVAFARQPRRQPTGYYLSAGSVGEVIVPAELVDRGYSILVGAHTADHKDKRDPKRLDRVSTRFEIINAKTKIANPLGGGVYIEVPNRETLGPREIQLRGVIKSPLYSLRDFDKTTAEEWLTQRGHPGPWADFVSDKFMMQVPTSWIYAFDEPEELMNKWDSAMDGVSEYMGILPKDRNKEVLYLQPDLHIRHSAYGIGYPQINQLYNPNDDEVGNSDHWMLEDPTHDSVEYHELGHAQLITMFPGEGEAIVNFPHAYVRNVKFGVDFETAFAESRGAYNKNYTVDEAAINWMVTPNFGNHQPMDKSNTPDDEFRYQQRGYAKYADIVRLYGWGAYTSFNRQEHLDFINNVDASELSQTDSRILRLSVAAGFDLTPLIHFWGVHPTDPTALAYAIRINDLERDIKLKELLSRYLSIIPGNNQMFNEHFERLYPGRPEGGDSRYGLGWYNAWRNVWNEFYAEKAKAAQKGLIDQYYDAPLFTSSPAFSLTKGSSNYIGQVTATDPQGDAITYSISGKDASLINIDSTTGDLTFNSSDTLSSYKAIIAASDGINSTLQNITVSVINLACDNVVLTDDVYIENRSGGVETFAFGDTTGYKFSAGQFMEVVDQGCAQLGKDSENFGVSFWLKDSIDPAAPGDVQIIGTKSQYNDDQGFIVYAQYQPGREKVHIKTVSSSGLGEGYKGVNVPQSGDIVPGEWTHIAINYRNDGADSTFTIFINKVDSVAGWQEEDEAAPNVYNSNLIIGDQADDNPDFQIARLRIFQRLITQKEINQLYLDGEADAVSAGE